MKNIVFGVVLSFCMIGAGTARAAPPPAKGGVADDVAKAARKEAAEVRNYLAEAMLNSKVRAALLKHLQGADGARVKVDVEGTTVILAGEVKERVSMKLAGEVARSVEGVTAVSNRVKLTADAKASDGMEARLKDTVLETEVKTRILASSGEAALKVEVEAADGVVSVRGTVPAAKKEEILKTVRGIAGVREVKDLLQAR